MRLENQHPNGKTPSPEQVEIQLNKTHYRLLEEYDELLVPGYHELIPSPMSAVADFLAPYTAGKDITIANVLEGMHQQLDAPVEWVDLGGGSAVAMSQFRCQPDTFDKFQLTNVDLFDPGLQHMPEERLELIEEFYPEVTDPQVRPNFIQADICEVELPTPAHFMTSVESIQYVDDPLRMIANGYNQLALGGLMAIVSGHNWANWLSCRRDANDYELRKKPTAYLLDALEENCIPFAATETPDTDVGRRPRLDRGNFRSLIIQKVPDTKLMIHSEVTRISKDDWDAKFVDYALPEADTPFLSVTSDL